RAWIGSSATLQRWSLHPCVTVVCWAMTMYWTLLGWLIFRVSDLHQLGYAVRAFMIPDGSLSLTAFGMGNSEPISVLAAVVGFALLHALGRRFGAWSKYLDTSPPILRRFAYFCLGMALFLGWPYGNEPFIYFQF
ncbi:MAG TPA: hypothetical protein VIY86_06355, partial [Pirellulaceae bacterium]